MDQQQNRPNWEMIISLAIIMITTLGTTIPLHIQTNNQIDAIHQEIIAIHQEMKDFHGRLCIIEERQRAEK